MPGGRRAVQRCKVRERTLQLAQVVVRVPERRLQDRKPRVRRGIRGRERVFARLRVRRAALDGVRGDGGVEVLDRQRRPAACDPPRKAVGEVCAEEDGGGGRGEVRRQRVQK